MYLMFTTPHPWQHSYNEFKEQVLPYLQSEGKTIGAKSAAGDETCAKIIGCYQLLYKSFDPMTFDRLKEHIEAYKAAV